MGKFAGKFAKQFLCTLSETTSNQTREERPGERGARGEREERGEGGRRERERGRERRGGGGREGEWVEREREMKNLLCVRDVNCPDKKARDILGKHILSSVNSREFFSFFRSPPPNPLHSLTPPVPPSPTLPKSTCIKK
jgi:hypothetical protein